MATAQKPTAAHPTGAPSCNCSRCLRRFSNIPEQLPGETRTEMYMRTLEAGDELRVRAHGLDEFSQLFVYDGTYSAGYESGIYLIALPLDECRRGATPRRLAVPALDIWDIELVRAVPRPDA